MAKGKEQKGIMSNLRGFIDDFYFKNAMGEIERYKSSKIAELKKVDKELAP